MLFLEIQREKSEMPKWSDKHRELGVTISCTIRAMKKMAHCGQKEADHHQNLILGDSWVSSIKTAKVKYKSGHE
jgi:hypothetical protein